MKMTEGANVSFILGSQLWKYFFNQTLKSVISFQERRGGKKKQHSPHSTKILTYLARN